MFSSSHRALHLFFLSDSSVPFLVPILLLFLIHITFVPPFTLPIKSIMWNEDGLLSTRNPSCTYIKLKWFCALMYNSWEKLIWCHSCHWNIKRAHTKMQTQNLLLTVINTYQVLITKLSRHNGSFKILDIFDILFAHISQFILQKLPMKTCNLNDANAKCFK